jgi:hypothetical protein
VTYFEAAGGNLLGGTGYVGHSVRSRGRTIADFIGRGCARHLLLFRLREERGRSNPTWMNAGSKTALGTFMLAHYRFARSGGHSIFALSGIRITHPAARQLRFG